MVVELTVLGGENGVLDIEGHLIERDIDAVGITEATELDLPVVPVNDRGLGGGNIVGRRHLGAGEENGESAHHDQHPERHEREHLAPRREPVPNAGATRARVVDPHEVILKCWWSGADLAPEGQATSVRRTTNVAGFLPPPVNRRGV